MRYLLVAILLTGLLLPGCSGGGGEQRAPTAPTLSSVTVFPSSVATQLDGTRRFTTSVKDDNGNIRENVAVEWSTANQNVAIIDGNGILTAVGEGTTTVRAIYGSLRSNRARVTVTRSPPQDPPRPLLPPWYSYCDGTVCNDEDTPPVIVALCPEGEPSCTPARSTTVIPQVNGDPISGMLLPLVKNKTVNGYGLPGTTIRHISGDGDAVNAHPKFVRAYDASSVRLQSDHDLRLTSYGVEPSWGGTTDISFVSVQLTDPLIDLVFFRHQSYAPDTSIAQLHAKAQELVRREVEMTGITDNIHPIVYFLPGELTATRLGGEGNFSFGNGVMTINYGNPLYLSETGGIAKGPLARLSHEHAHELFHSIASVFPDNSICLNEGIADAVGFMSGFLPVEDFGPHGVRGLNFEDGCQEQTGNHDIGNCSLWHVKKAGLLTPAFIRGLFTPQHTFVFDSCVLNRETGDSLLVYFTEAANGANMVPVLDAAKIPHAASYAEAKLALGL